MATPERVRAARRYVEAWTPYVRYRQPRRREEDWSEEHAESLKPDPMEFGVKFNLVKYQTEIRIVRQADAEEKKEKD
jgi:hypothetical protein